MTTDETLFPPDDPDFDVPPLEEPEPEPVTPSPRPAKEPDAEAKDTPEPPRRAQGFSSTVCRFWT